MKTVIVTRKLFFAFAIATSLLIHSGVTFAARLDYSGHAVTVTDPDPGFSAAYGSPQELTDGLRSCSWAWVRDDLPKNGKPAVVVFDYHEPVTVAALGHYFYVPDSRDQRMHDWFSGPSSFKSVSVYTSDDGQTWKQVAALEDIPVKCPQLLAITEPTQARFLKLEVLSLTPGAARVRSYEIDTYLDEVPSKLPVEVMKAVRTGFPNKSALKAPIAKQIGLLAFDKGSDLIRYELPVQGATQSISGKIDVQVDGKPVIWDESVSEPAIKVAGVVNGQSITVSARFVSAGIHLKFHWNGPISSPYARLDINASMGGKVSEWRIPEYYSSKTAPTRSVLTPTAAVPTAVATISDEKRSLSIVPDTDRSWIGFLDDKVSAVFPLNSEDPNILLIPSNGGWFSGFERAAVEVFDFKEPRQFSPVSQAISDLCKFLMQPALWSEKYQMMRSFPDTDFFYIFYSLPYSIPALTYWERMTDDSAVAKKVDSILKSTLDLRKKGGPMKGAIFSEYADKQLCNSKTVPYAAWSYYDWHVNYNEKLVGMDQGANRWITSHTMGGVLWAVTHVWRFRGELSPELKSASIDVADWMVNHLREDGSWPYAFNEDGSVSSPQSDSGTVWGIWALHRFGDLTGNKKYSDAAHRALAYFKKTFTDNHLYRGYWEDNYSGGKTVLNSGQGYESSIAGMMYAEVGDIEAMSGSVQDSMQFITTRKLEARTYETSYAGASEQHGWAPGTYISPAFGRGAQLAWQKTHKDIYDRFSALAKGIGWWQDRSGGAVWLGAAIMLMPIEMYRVEGGQRQFWAIWDSAQKVTFSVPWLVDEINRRSGNKIRISAELLVGTDDRNHEVTVRYFDGRVSSESGQVNWLALGSNGKKIQTSGNQLVLINHAQATEAIVEPKLRSGLASVRIINGNGRYTGPAKLLKGGGLHIKLPARSIAVIEWDGK